MDRDKLKVAWVEGAIDIRGKTDAVDDTGGWAAVVGTPLAAARRGAGPAEADIRGEIPEKETRVEETNGTADNQLAAGRTPSWWDEPNRMDEDTHSPVMTKPNTESH